MNYILLNKLFYKDEKVLTLCYAPTNKFTFQSLKEFFGMENK